MKNIQLTIFFIASLFLFISCSKSEADPDTCEDTNETQVTFRNTTSENLRAVLSARLNPQYEPVDVVYTIDLTPGQEELKVFQAGRYVVTWYNDCATSCSSLGFLFKDYLQCEEYTEQR